MVRSKYRYIVIATGLSLIFSGTGLTLADDHGKVRIYKLNKKQQLLRQRWVKKPGVEGCHRLSKLKKAHRFAQSGYDFCSLYTGENCEKGTEVTAKWSGKKYRSADFDVAQPQIKLLPGSQWILAPTQNVEIQSWSCQY